MDEKEDMKVIEILIEPSIIKFQKKYREIQEDKRVIEILTEFKPKPEPKLKSKPKPKPKTTKISITASMTSELEYLRNEIKMIIDKN